eukprot:CAMPEP_0119301434 /NCGR_PEP_ID=MMETSP1333-20130426/3212_1 /TAXON_ID=418940 /ORGANISM="Scyphosphaera apsteinii, Strain RCC1455" /LENGTH=449 /DNA_ID=CAMNT_0007303505 /DNA_START=176 /DNA_END=1525 /DNA_ORIENTATION=+
MNCIKLVMLIVAFGQATAHSAVRQPLSETNKRPPVALFAQLHRCKTAACARARRSQSTSNYTGDKSGSLQKHWEKLPGYKPDALACKDFARDGVAVLRNVIPDKKMLRRLDMLMFEHAHAFQFKEYDGKSWLYDAGSRMLVTGGVRLARAAAIVGYQQARSKIRKELQEVKIIEAPIWGMNASTYFSVESREHIEPFHSDGMITRAEELLRIHPQHRERHMIVSMWLAINDAGQPLELVSGTHTVEERIAAHAECNMSSKVVGGARLLNKACVYNRAKRLGQEFIRPVLRAGDAIIFNGQTLHRGLAQTKRRIGISFRFNLAFEEKAACQSRPVEGSFAPLVEPLDASLHRFWAEMPFVKYRTAKSSCAQRLKSDACMRHKRMEYRQLCKCSICLMGWLGEELSSNNSLIDACSPTDIMKELLPNNGAYTYTVGKALYSISKHSNSTNS